MQEDEDLWRIWDISVASLSQGLKLNCQSLEQIEEWTPEEGIALLLALISLERSHDFGTLQEGIGSAPWSPPWSPSKSPPFPEALIDLETRLETT